MYPTDLQTLYALVGLVRYDENYNPPKKKRRIAYIKIPLNFLESN